MTRSFFKRAKRASRTPKSSADSTYRHHTISNQDTALENARRLSRKRKYNPAYRSLGENIYHDRM